MKIKFLGTGSVCGVPEWNCDCGVCKSKNPKDKRLRSSLLVRIGNKNIVIDFGPDFRTQLLKYGIRKLDYALLTHAHGDHMNGYMELARQKNLVLEAPEEVLDEFFERMGSSKEWLKTRNPTIKIMPFKRKILDNVVIDVVALKHQKDYEKRFMPCFGFLFKTKKSKFAYLSDYNEILEVDKLKNLDLLVSDGSGFEYGDNGHAGVKGSIEIFKKLKPKRMLLTHIRHTTGHEFLAEFVKKFGNIEIAFDGMEIELE